MGASAFPIVLETILFTAVTVILLFAAASDLIRFIIPNYISIALAVLFFLAWSISPVGTQLWSHVGAGLLVLVVGMMLFRHGLLGGGDVKLWSAAALWFGLGSLHIQLACVSVIGGALGITLYVVRLCAARYRGGRGSTFPRVLQIGEGVPYGIAIASGTIIGLNKTPFFQHLFA
jgi:prepilin peptidase CpaA